MPNTTLIVPPNPASIKTSIVSFTDSKSVQVPNATLATAGNVIFSDHSWSGYEASPVNELVAKISGANASWIVQPALSSNVTTSSAQWVGIDGQGLPDLIQIGTGEETASFYRKFNLPLKV